MSDFNSFLMMMLLSAFNGGVAALPGSSILTAINVFAAIACGIMAVMIAVRSD